MEISLLLFLALLPGFLLLFYIVYMDRNEQEPLGQVLKIILLGALSVVPAALLEHVLAFLPLYFGNTILDGMVGAFIRVSWVEELCKLGVVLLFAWKTKYFNEENDGIVYVGASALGFAMLENVAYVLSHGFGTGLLRAITAMPLHCFTGVVMGYYTGLAKFSESKHHMRVNLFKGFFLAFLIHGVYDALLMTRTPAAILIFPLVLGLVLFGIHFLKKGRALSLARISGTGEVKADTTPTIAQQQDLLVRVSPRNQIWKIFVSRALLTLSGLFWVTVILGIIIKSDSLKAGGGAIVMGTIVLTFFPISIGTILEMSYHKKKRLYGDLRKTVPEPESFRIYTGTKPVSDTILRAPTVVWPPRQLWRAILARTILIICVLLWALAILVTVSDAPGAKKDSLYTLVVIFIITFFPIYIGLLLEDSYRKLKKRFSELLRVFPNGRIPAEKLVLSPPGQLWKIIISRFLFGCVVETTSMIFLGGLFSNARQSTVSELVWQSLLINIIPLIIAILLEKSYRKKKEEFQQNQMQDFIPNPDHAKLLFHRAL